MSRNKKPVNKGEWLFLSFIVSTIGAVIASHRGIGYAILVFFLTMALCSLRLLNK